MELSQLILTRRTVHNYRTEKVSDAIVEQALALSLWAPNHKLTFPWVYTSIGPQARAKLAELAVELKGKKAPLTEIKAKAVRESVLNPSHLIALGYKKSGEAHREHEDYATLSCSVQLASLYLWEQGISTKWSTGGWSVHERTYGILGLDPAEVKLEGCLMIGMATMQPATPIRPGLSEFLRTTT